MGMLAALMTGLITLATVVPWLIILLFPFFLPLIGIAALALGVRAFIRGTARAQKRVPQMLLVDDEPISLSVMQYVLRQQNIGFTVVENGYQMTEALGRSEYDGVILDYNLPGMNGAEALQFADRSLAGLNLPVFAYSGEAKTRWNMPMLDNFKFFETLTKSDSPSRIKAELGKVVFMGA